MRIGFDIGMVKKKWLSRVELCFRACFAVPNRG